MEGDGYLESLISRAGASNSVILPVQQANELKALIPGLQDEIANIEDRLEILKSKRDARATRLKRIRATVAPHKKLPVEILTRIFYLCGQRFLNVPADLGPKNAPWNLRQVCSTWRQLALSQDFLWNRVCAQAHFAPNEDVGNDEYRSWGSRLRMAQNLLSKKGLVSLSIWSEYRTMEHAREDIGAALDDLVDPCAHRLEELNIDCPLHGYVAILDANPALFRRLESLSLSISGYQEGDPLLEDIPDPNPFATWPTFEEAQRLRKFMACGEGHFLDSIRVQIVPWDQLTHLTFKFVPDEEGYPGPAPNTGPSWHQFLPTLSQCNNLTSCKVRLRSRTEDLKPPHVTLAHLRSLSLNLRETDPLSALTLPSLEKLHLDQKHLSPRDIASLVERSCCMVRVITDKQDYDLTEVEETSSTDYDYLLRRLDHLQELRTLVLLESSDIIQIAQGTRLPQLETLHFGSQLAKIAVLRAFEQGFSSALETAGSTRKLRHVICEYSDGIGVEEPEEDVNAKPEIEEKLRKFPEKYGVSLQFSPSRSMCISARVKK